jgi:hypothetical protein
MIQEKPKSLGPGDIAVRRDIFERVKDVIPVADLSGKGIFDSVSSNQSKQNDQKS